MLPLQIKIIHLLYLTIWYFRGSDDTLTVGNPTLEKKEKEPDNEESDNESYDAIFPPTVNHPVKLRLHNR